MHVDEFKAPETLGLGVLDFLQELADSFRLEVVLLVLLWDVEAGHLLSLQCGLAPNHGQVVPSELLVQNLL